MKLAGCQINPIDVNFYLQKGLEIFDTNSDDKIQSQNYMPIRVKQPLYEYVRAYVIEEKFTSNNNFSLS